LLKPPVYSDEPIKTTREVIMKHNKFNASIVLLLTFTLTGCASSSEKVIDESTPTVTPTEVVISTTPQPIESSTPSPITSVSSSATSEKKEVAGKEDKTESVKIPEKKTPRPINTASKPDKNSGASKPTKSVIPCGMMDSETKEIGKCPPPVTPTKIIIGESYPWFPVAPGKLAEPWGITGELLYANDFVTLLKITPSEIVIVSDRFSIRGLTRIIGATSAEVDTTQTYTFVKFLCKGVVKTNNLVKHYNYSNIVPDSLLVLYKEEISEIEINC
jgi:hypothetical protein